MSIDADVVVVGARAAGASTAMLAARAGLSVLLLDRDRPDADTLSTHALMRGGVVQLARWNLLDQIVAAGTPAIRHTTFHYTGADVTLSIKPSAGVDALYAPRRTLLDPLLVDAARAAGAVVRHRIAVVGLRRDDRGRVTGVEIRDRDGRIATVHARLVVGADGRRSTIARLAAAPLTHATTHTSAFVYGYWSDLDADGYEWAYRPGAAAGFIPTNHDQTCVFASGPRVPRRSRWARGPPLARPPSLAGHGRATARRHSTPSDENLRRAARSPPPALGARLGARRRRRIMEGPDQRPRPHRRPTRRRTARASDHRHVHRRADRR